jgi:hypothetical protein
MLNGWVRPSAVVHSQLLKAALCPTRWLRESKTGIPLETTVRRQIQAFQGDWRIGED